MIGRDLSPELWSRIETLVDELLDLDAVDRPDALRKIEATDPEVATHVGALLAAMEDGARGVLESPVFVGVPELFADATEEVASGRSGAQLGPYRLGSVLGRGGMGVVYLAERIDQEFEQRVAIKLMPRGLESDEAERRFRLERQVLARLEHPNVARLLDGGVTDEGYPYLVMELVDGVPVDEYCDEGDLALDERVALMIDVCGAVQYAHQNLVIHRDLKPANIMVTEEGSAKLLDFGVAKLIEEGPEATSHTRFQPGTAAYASPEQRADRPVSTASDVYSLGVVLYKVVAGGLPGSDKPPPSELPGDLQRIVLKAMAEDASARYATAAALGDDLGRYLAGQPVTAQEPTAAYRLRKFVARHRKGVSATVVAAGALAAALVVALWQAERARTAAERAERVATLLQELFVDSDPYAPTSGEVTVPELLDRGLGRVRTELADDPELRSRLLDVLGRAYIGQGLRDEGVAVLEEVLAERRRSLGDRHPLTADSMRYLGYAVLEIGKTEEAASLIEESLAIVEEQFGPDSPEFALHFFSLGLLRGAQGDYESQEAIFRRLVEFHGRADEPSSSFALALGQLAVALDYQGRDSESLEIQRQALETAEQTMGAAHPYTAALRGNLGLRLHGAGQFEEAAIHHREALEALESRPGVHEEELVPPLSNLGLALMAKGDFVGAAEHIRRSAEIARRSSPPDDFTRIGAEINLATVEREMGRLETAEEIYRSALARFEELLGPEHQATARARCLLGMTLALSGDTAQAERELEAALAVQRSGTTSPMSPDETLLALGRFRLDQGRLDEAEPLLSEALEYRRDRFPAGSWQLAEIELELAALAAGRGERDAELAISFDSLIEALPPNNHRLVRAQALLGIR